MGNENQHRKRPEKDSSIKSTELIASNFTPICEDLDKTSTSPTANSIYTRSIHPPTQTTIQTPATGTGQKYNTAPFSPVAKQIAPIQEPIYDEVVVPHDAPEPSVASGQPQIVSPKFPSGQAPIPPASKPPILPAGSYVKNPKASSSILIGNPAAQHYTNQPQAATAKTQTIQTPTSQKGYGEKSNSSKISSSSNANQYHTSGNILETAHASPAKMVDIANDFQMVFQIIFILLIAAVHNFVTT